jgi:hypothetical protein
VYPWPDPTWILVEFFMQIVSTQSQIKSSFLTLVLALRTEATNKTVYLTIMLILASIPTTTSLVDHARHVGSDTVVVQKTLGLSNSSDGNVLVPQVSLGTSLDVVDGDRVNRSGDLLRSESLSGGDHLTTNLHKGACQSLDKLY